MVAGEETQEYGEWCARCDRRQTQETALILTSRKARKSEYRNRRHTARDRFQGHRKNGDKDLPHRRKCRRQSVTEQAGKKTAPLNGGLFSLLTAPLVGDPGIAPFRAPSPQKKTPGIDCTGVLQHPASKVDIELG
jgi:hypothetical protein